MSTSLRSLDRRAYPYLEWLYRVAESEGLRPRITSTRRTRAQQVRLYRRYLAGLQPYPVARPGTSPHERGLAIDMVSRDNETLGRWWRSQGGRWLGPRDPVHFDVL